MKYIAFIFASLFSTAAFAEDSGTIMHVPEYAEQDEIDANLPQCDDVLLVDATVEEIKKYLSEQPEGSIIENRNRNLVLNYINSYKEKNVEEFNPKENYLVADTMIKLKINQHVRSENMRLCVSDGKKPVYLLIYPEDFRYNVEVINLSSAPENLHFLYTPPVPKYENFED